MPFGFHLTMDTLPSGDCKWWLQLRLGCIRLLPSCPFRLLHTFHSSGQRGYQPRFRIRCSSSEHRRDFNPPDQRAAQRTHIGLSEARGLVLSWVVREGIGVTRRLSARWALHAYRRLGYSLSNPSVSRTDPALPEQESSEMERALPRDAQAACEFSLSISKSSPFFHRVNVMAAILRARVRRTMVGLMPLASER